MARKRSSEINIENYVNGSPITPGVTYKLGDADTHTAWLLASSSYSPIAVHYPSLTSSQKDDNHELTRTS